MAEEINIDLDDLKDDSSDKSKSDMIDISSESLEDISPQNSGGTEKLQKEMNLFVSQIIENYEETVIMGELDSSKFKAFILGKKTMILDRGEQVYPDHLFKNVLFFSELFRLLDNLLENIFENSQQNIDIFSAIKNATDVARSRVNDSLFNESLQELKSKIPSQSQLSNHIEFYYAFYFISCDIQKQAIVLMSENINYWKKYEIANIIKTLSAQIDVQLSMKIGVFGTDMQSFMSQ